MIHYDYEEPKAIELTISNPIDRIANIAHSCYQVAPKEHEANVNFVKTLCSVYHMAMLDHGFMHFKFKKEEFINNLDDHQKLEMIPWDYAKFFNFATDDNFVYLTLSLRSITNAIDGIYKGNKSDSINHINKDEGSSFKKLICTIISNLDDESKSIVLTHFKPEDNIDEFINNNKIDVSVITVEENEIDSLDESIRDSQKILVYRLTTDRGVTHELVRHRLCSFAQESTRYCNYSKQKFGDKIHIIKPLDYVDHQAMYDIAFNNAAEAYFELLHEGAKPEQARAVLPTNLKAEITITANLAEWKHIFFQRLALDAHPEARRVVKFVYEDMKSKGYIE